MTRRTLAIVLLIPFLVLSAYAVWDVGFFGIFEYHLHSSAGWQVFTDLVLSLILLLTYLVPQAQRDGRNPWPWVVGTLFVGVISPLLYLATDKSSADESSEAQTA